MSHTLGTLGEMLAAKEAQLSSMSEQLVDAGRQMREEAAAATEAAAAAARENVGLRG